MAEAKKQTKKKASDDIKSKFWTCVVYPESAPEDWRENLQISGLKAAISPLHDKDVNPTGEPKKPHFHVILCWDGPTTFKNAERFVKTNFNAPIPKELKSVRGMYNYFSHKDNPEKAQYDENLITHVNQFSLAEFVELTRAEVNNAIKSCMKIIRDVGITEFSGLLDFLEDNGLGDEWDVAKNNVFLFNTYITSKRNAEKQYAEDYAKIEAAKIRAARLAKTEENGKDEKITPFD